MAEKTSYPQIPSTVWWGVRALFHRSPSAKVDEHFLSAELGVQEAAARQYIYELRRVGLVSDEGRATTLAGKWRLDDSYAEAVTEILERQYPEGLRQLGDPGSVDRQKIIAWFMSHGLGAGAAKNKASAYTLIGSSSPNESPAKSGEGESNGKKKTEKVRQPRSAPPVTPSQKTVSKQSTEGRAAMSADAPSLNVNVQIHISADATGDQIEKIFSAMKRYLYEGA